MRFVCTEPLTRFADDDGQFEFVVKLPSETFGVHNGVVGSDDGIDILEEHDALVHGMGPVHRSKFVVVIGKVSGRVEELLRHDRGAQANIGQRQSLSRFSHLSAALEPLPCRAAGEFDNGVILDPTNSPPIECRQLHAWLLSVVGVTLSTPSRDAG